MRINWFLTAFTVVWLFFHSIFPPQWLLLSFCCLYSTFRFGMLNDQEGDDFNTKETARIAKRGYDAREIRRMKYKQKEPKRRNHALLRKNKKKLRCKFFSWDVRINYIIYNLLRNFFPSSAYMPSWKLMYLIFWCFYLIQNLVKFFEL